MGFGGKACRVCKQRKHLREYHKNKYGYLSICTACFTQRMLRGKYGNRGRRGNPDAPTIMPVESAPARAKTPVGESQAAVLWRAAAERRRLAALAKRRAAKPKGPSRNWQHRVSKAELRRRMSALGKRGGLARQAAWRARNAAATERTRARGTRPLVEHPAVPDVAPTSPAWRNPPDTNVLAAEVACYQAISAIGLALATHPDDRNVLTARDQVMTALVLFARRSASVTEPKTVVLDLKE